jgi:imidazolonepropionase-like amidohydrolase
LSEDYIRYAKRLIEKQLELVAAMQRAGVKIMAGTDRGPGDSSLHEELALLVTVGLTPMEALITATRNPAEFLGELHRLGTVERGKIADLVLLDADPLVSISNTRRINAVVLDGRFIPRSSF